MVVTVVSDIDHMLTSDTCVLVVHCVSVVWNTSCKVPSEMEGAEVCAMLESVYGRSCCCCVD